MLSESSKFALIVPIFLMLLGGIQLGNWLVWRNQRALQVLGIAFIAASCGMLVQILGWSEPFWSRVLAFSSCYYLAAGLGGIALAQRLNVNPCYKVVLGLGLILLSVQLIFSTIFPSFLGRVYALSVGAMFLLGLPLLQWRHMNIRNMFDHYLRCIYVAFIGINIIRTFFQVPIGREFSYSFLPGEFIETGFWLSLYILLLVTLTGFAVILHSAILRDLISKLHSDRNQDALTHVLNRRGFYEATDSLFAQYANQSFHAQLLFCDADHFKSINDRFGHMVGDEVLRNIAAELKKNSRTGDIIARMGGEEFAVILPLVDTPHATLIANRLNQAIADMQIVGLDGNKVSISIGVATLAQPNQEALKKAMREADRYLYEAKNNGRNQVISELNADLVFN